MGLCAACIRLLLFRGRKEQITLVCLFVLNFIITVIVLNGNLDDEKDTRNAQRPGRRVLLVAMAHSPAGDVFLMPDLETDTVAATDKASTGYGLAKRVQEKCSRTAGTPYSKSAVQVYMPYTSHDNRTQVCAIWKIATTFTKRLFMIENGIGGGQMTYNPYDISYSQRYVQWESYMTNSESVGRFMFTRDPYSRLYAAYIDKLFAPNPMFWKNIGIPAIKSVRKEIHGKSLQCGHDLKFSEYIKYVIRTLTNVTDGPLDGHSVSMTMWCKPCEVKYDFIGKIESFKNGSLELIRRLNLPKTERLLRERGEELAADDAIRDTLHQAFDDTYFQHYKGCVSFREALRRSWKKMQYRGLIGNTELPLADEEVDKLTFYQAINMARKARAISTKEERQALKRRHFMNLYSSVTLFDLNMLKHIYRDDFDLFEYESTPEDIFNRV